MWAWRKLRKKKSDWPPPLTATTTEVDEIVLSVTARCPCGSTVAQPVSLIQHGECRRCGRAFGIRSFVYTHSRAPLPVTAIEIGYVGDP